MEPYRPFCHLSVACMHQFLPVEHGNVCRVAVNGTHSAAVMAHAQSTTHMRVLNALLCLLTDFVVSCGKLRLQNRAGSGLSGRLECNDTLNAHRSSRDYRVLELVQVCSHRMRHAVLYTGPSTSKNRLLPFGDLHTHLAHPILPSNRHLDRFSRLCRAHKQTDRHT